MKLSLPRFVLTAVLLCTAALYAAFIHRSAFASHGGTAFTLVDDAMISMRYARNLASGAGLVWNAGEPPIEGFTNLLWVGVMTGLHLLSLPPSTTSLAVMLLSAAALLTNIVVVWRISREISPFGVSGPAFAILLTGVYFPLVYWSLRGMELGLVVLLLNTALLCLLRLDARPDGWNLWTLAVALSLALWTRPDSLVEVFVLLLVALGLLRHAGRISSAVTLMCVVLAAGGALIAFRILYFGDMLPNTYYLKVTGAGVRERMEAGMRVLTEKSGPLILFLTFAAGGAFFIGDTRLRKAVGLLLALFFAQTAYAVLIGGDFADRFVGGEGRFLAQGFSSLLLAYGLVLPRLLHVGESEPGTAHTVRWSGVYVLLLAGLGSAGLVSGKEWSAWSRENAPMLRSDIERMNIGLFLERVTKSDAVVAVHAAGNIPYYCRRRVIDLLGKSDRVIAHGPSKGAFVPGHNKWNYEYSLGTLHPDVIADGWEPLWEYLQAHPGEYRYVSPHGIFVRTDSAGVTPDIFSRDSL